MEFITQVATEAWSALLEFDSSLGRVVGLTLTVSGLATLIGCLLGVPLGAFVVWGRFRGRAALRVAIGIGMGMPPVLVGLGFLILLWRSGPLGFLGLTFTPTAMVVAQVMLAAPIAAGVTIGALETFPPVVAEQLMALRVSTVHTIRLALIEGRRGVVSAVVAAFGRVIAEVGAVLVVGGNILDETRVLTTLIVQESRQGRFGVAVAAGVVLMFISLVVNVVLDRVRGRV